MSRVWTESGQSEICLVQTITSSFNGKFRQIKTLFKDMKSSILIVMVSRENTFRVSPNRLWKSTNCIAKYKNYRYGLARFSKIKIPLSWKNSAPLTLLPCFDRKTCFIFYQSCR